jgi:hypothetical protein
MEDVKAIATLGRDGPLDSHMLHHPWGLIRTKHVVKKRVCIYIRRHTQVSRYFC